MPARPRPDHPQTPTPDPTTADNTVTAILLGDHTWRPVQPGTYHTRKNGWYGQPSFTYQEPAVTIAADHSYGIHGGTITGDLITGPLTTIQALRHTNPTTPTATPTGQANQ
jgi:hypothetical protein